MSGSCCPECHFEWEEKNAAPFLPVSLRKRLLGEHRRLVEAGFPKAAVLEHAEREMAWFRRHCPPHICAKIEEDHRKYAAEG